VKAEKSGARGCEERDAAREERVAEAGGSRSEQHLHESTEAAREKVRRKR
jgi:hypothetical protein